MRAIGWLLAVLGALAICAWGFAYIGVVNIFHKEFPVAFHSLGAVGFLLIGLWLFLDWGSLSALGKDQTVTRSATSGLLLLVATGLLVVVNVVGHRYDKRWDLTSTKRFSLSDQTVTILEGLKEPVSVIAFFQKGSPEDTNFRELMKGYVEHSTLIDVKYYDPQSNNVVAAAEKITSGYGTVIVRIGDREQRITSGFEEEGLTNAIVKATSTSSHSFCAVGGHGEGGADDESEPGGLGGVISTLTKQNYVLSTVQLMSAQPKPADCEVLLLAGPKVELLPTELDRIAQYVAAGGKFIALLDPIGTPNTAADMARYGVKVGHDLVIEVDPGRQIPEGGPSFVVLDGESFNGHPITSKIDDAVLMPLAESVGKGAPIAGLTVTELAHSSSQSWAETKLDTLATEQPSPDPATDLAGPVPLMVAVEVTDPAAIAEASPVVAMPALDGAPVVAAPPPPPSEKLEKKAGGRVIVVGNSNFAVNQFSPWHQNADLLLGMVGWMVGDENQITIHANDSKTGQLEVGLIGMLATPLVAFFGVPGLALLGAVGTFMRRRSR